MSKTDTSIFDDIISAPKVDPLEKYASLFNGINLNELSTLDQVTAFVPLMKKVWSDNSPLTFTPPAVVAIPSGMQTTVANAIPVEAITADGFPSNKKAHYFYQFGDRVCNVALLVRMYFSPNPGGVFLEISTKG